MNKDIGDVVKRTCDTYDHIAEDYVVKIDRFLSNSWVGQFEKRLLDRFLSIANPPKPWILDIGCGNGKDTCYLGQQSAAALGIDISSGMLREARKHLPDGDFYRMDMRNLGFSSELFDGVWANGCIYHVPKKDLIYILKEIQRVLKPSGIFSFNFKVGTGEKLEENPRSYQGSPRFYSYYSISEMERFLEQTSFVVIDKQPYMERIFNEEIVQFWARNVNSL